MTTRFKRIACALVVSLMVLSGSLVRASTLGLERVHADAFIVIDGQTGQVILESHPDVPHAIASLTKIVTASVVLSDPAYDPKAELTVPPEATQFNDPESVRLGLKPGERIKAGEAMKAMLIFSANDCAYLLAYHYGASEGSFQARMEAFCNKMNAYARSKGANNSSFNNPVGFDVQGHQSTARDVALLTGYAFHIKGFPELVSQRVVRLAPTNIHKASDWALLPNRNPLVLYGREAYPSAWFTHYDGVKTGTTPKAGHCLVASGALGNGHRLIGVLLNADLKTPDGGTSLIAEPMFDLLEAAAKRLSTVAPGAVIPLQTTPDGHLATSSTRALPETTARPSPVTSASLTDSATHPVDRADGHPLDPIILGLIVLLVLLIIGLLVYLIKANHAPRRRPAPRRRR